MIECDIAKLRRTINTNDCFTPQSERERESSVAETLAGLLPSALRAPLFFVLHAVHFAAFLVLAAHTPGGDGNFGELVGLVRDVDRLREDPLAVGLDQLALVLGILVRWTGEVAMRQGRRGCRIAYVDFCVVEFFLALFTVKRRETMDFSVIVS